MNKKMRFCRWLLIVLVIAIGGLVVEPGRYVLGPAEVYANSSASSIPVFIVERGVPQVFNGITIVNYAACVINPSDETLVVDIESPVPKDLYVVSDFYPQFGKEAQLDEPLYHPYEVEVSEYTVLDEPVIDQEQAEVVVFRWTDVAIPPHEGVIVQYDNYFGDVAQFYLEDGLKMSTLVIHTQYDVSLEDDIAELTLSYDLENTGDQEDIEFLMLEVFLPDTILNVGEQKADVQLLEVTELSLSPNVVSGSWLISDGFDSMAKGNLFSAKTEKLPPGEHHRFFLRVKGIRKTEVGEIYPLIILNCQMKGRKVWQSIELKSDKSLDITRFYYTKYSTAIPDSKLFKFEPDTIRVVDAQAVPEPTFYTLRPKGVSSEPTMPPLLPLPSEEQETVPVVP